jgi:PPOX class probable F420-dependent enzyme
MSLDADVVRLAKAATLATVVTLMPDGQPQAQLTWIDTDGENILINTEPQRQRGKNIRRDPRVTVLLHSDLDSGDWAEVRGHVVAATGGQAARDHIDELSRRYMGQDFIPEIGPQGRVIYTVRPDKVNTPRLLGS